MFYREAGPADAPVILLLHGFPTSSFQYREMIPRLADRYHAIAPDLPGFGFTEVAAERVSQTRVYLIPAGAKAFQRDLPEAVVELLPTGHFALETHLEDVVMRMRQFLSSALRIQ